MKIRKICFFHNPGLLLAIFGIIITVAFYSCSSFNYKTYDENANKDVEDPEPNYNITLDKDFQDFTNFMFIGNRIENFGSYFNTYFNAKENFDDAYDDYITQVLSNYGNRIDSIYINQPLSQEATDLFNKAIEKASRVIQYHKSSALMDRSVLLIGQCYFYLGDYIKAERKFSEFASKLYVSPDIDEDLIFYSKTQLRLGHADVALQRLQDLIQNTKSNSIKADAYQTIAEYYLSKKDFTTAVDNYRKAIELSSDSQFKAEMQFLLATVIAQNDYVNAAIEFDKVLDFNASYSLQFYAKLNRLKYLILAGDYHTAEPIIQNLRVKYKDDVDLLQQVDFLHGFYFDKKKEYKKAFDTYKQVIQDYPKSAASSNASFQIGKYYENVLSDYLNAYRYYRYSTEESGAGQYHNEAVAKTSLFKRYYDLRSDVTGVQVNTAYDSVFIANTTGKANQNNTNNNNGTNGTNGTNGNNGENPGKIPDHKGGGESGTFSDSLSRSDTTQVLKQNDSIKTAPSKLLDSIRTKYGNLKDSLKSIHGNLKDTVHAKNQNDTNQTNQQTQIDSSAIKIEKIAKAKFELAELFDYDLKRIDSSEYYYLSAFDETGDYDFKSRILYALSGLYKTSGNSAKADETLHRIIKEYPLSPMSVEAKIELNIPVEEISADASDSLFYLSENRFNNSDYSLALDGYKQLLTDYPNAVHFVKCCYSTGWIYENVLYKSDSAYLYYSRVIDSNPKSEYAAAISSKVKEYEDALKKTALDSAKVNDSTGTKLSGLKNDSASVDSGKVKIDSSNNKDSVSVLKENGDKTNEAPKEINDPSHSQQKQDLIKEDNTTPKNDNK